jgi:hypothetical protein
VNLSLYNHECEEYILGEASNSLKNLFIEGIFFKFDLNIRLYISHSFYVLSKKNSKFEVNFYYFLTLYITLQ